MGQITLNNFVKEIKSGNHSILELIGLTEKKFQEVPYAQILENPDDIAVGVVKVKLSFDHTIFGMFNGVLIKEHDDGEVRYIFYCTSKNYERIRELTEVVVSELGNGIYDSDRHKSILDFEKMKDLSQGVYGGPEDDLVSTWLLDSCIVTLQYKTKPLNEFSFFVSILPNRKIDTAIRRKGTILDILKMDLPNVLENTEDKKYIEVKDGKCVFVDYEYMLSPKILDVFDKTQVRIFGNERKFDSRIQTHVTFMSTQEVSTNKIVKTLDDLAKMYGEDEHGYAGIEIHEVDMLSEQRYWTGRTWTFNESHGLWNMQDSNEKPSYWVTVSYDVTESGFTLFIGGYNNLIELFSVR